MAVHFEPDDLAAAFRECVQKTLEDHCQVVFTKEPKAVILDIIEYESRLRVFGLEKFNDTCYIALQSLYENPADQENNDICGTLLNYIDEENAERLFKVFLKEAEGEDEDLIMENTKKLCSRICQRFQQTASRFGYMNLLASEPELYLSNIEEGAPFPYEEEKLYQVNCTLWREKVFVAELVLRQPRHG